MRYSPELEDRFQRLVTIYPWRRSALVPMLLYAQDEVGYITDEVVEDIAERLELTPLEVRNVISYYSLLRTRPAGKYVVQVCTNISCLVTGAEDVLETCKERLGVEEKEVTSDGKFSVEEVECIGACSWAPAVQVNYDFHLNVTPEKVDSMLNSYRGGAKA
ncbi:MAG TPA: NAD(P)H-dependent oxidoreductase subunit E [Terriglobales bacterium]|nr:NAD(P)H-dependent oxidoreductase subunit E [Terriglobales bacterium]